MGERACKQPSVARFQRVKSYRTIRAASVPPVYSLRMICAHDEFEKYFNRRSGNF